MKKQTIEKAVGMLRGTVNNEKGFLLLTTYLLISVLSIFSIAFLTRGTVFVQSAERNQNKVVAFNMAEAALDQAITELEADPTYIGTEGYVSLATAAIQGGYSVTVTTPEPTVENPDVSNVRLIEVSGFAPGNDNTVRAYETRAVDSFVQFSDASIFDFAVFADESLRINGTPLIDSYNSDEGPYDPETANDNGDIGTNSEGASSVDIIGNAEVNGDVNIGPEGNTELGETDSVVDLTGDVTISGSISQLDEEKNFSPNTTSLEDLGKFKVTGSTVYALAGGTYHFSEFTIGGTGSVVADGPIVIYVTGKVSLGGGGLVTSDNIPANFLIYVTDDSTVSVSGSADVYAGIYAPDSAISLNGSADFFGAIVGNTFTHSGTVDMHFDEALADVGTTAGNDLTVLSWQEQNTVLGEYSVVT